MTLQTRPDCNKKKNSGTHDAIHITRYRHTVELISIKSASVIPSWQDELWGGRRADNWHWKLPSSLGHPTARKPYASGQHGIELSQILLYRLRHTRLHIFKSNLLLSAYDNYIYRGPIHQNLYLDQNLYLSRNRRSNFEQRMNANTHQPHQNAFFHPLLFLF